ncbi:nicotinate (nicotinamide) nucleotide adenylyltransferase [Hydrogenobaculum acidophilum]
MGIAFFGGSFDPIHIGHILVARDVCELCGIDNIYFMPSFISPFKSYPIASPRDRFNMLKLALKDESWAFIEDIELKKEEVSYTYKSALILKEKYKQIPTFIIGYDAYLTLDKWYKYEELVKIAKFIVVKRGKDNHLLNKDVDAIFCNTRTIDISSTEIRKRIKEGKSIKHMVPDNVLKYIHKWGLYAKS